jgi:hypothetical protein
MALDAGEEDPQSHLMTIFPFQWIRAIFGIADLAVSST